MLYYLKAEILGEAADKAFEGTPARELDVLLPDIDYVEIPVDWWDAEADKSLLIGVFKHGYERYNAMRADPALCFLEKVGMPDEKSLSAEQGVTDGTSDIPERGNIDKEDSAEDKLDGLQKQTPRMAPTQTNHPGQFPLPSLLDSGVWSLFTSAATARSYADLKS